MQNETNTDIAFASLLASRLCHDLINPAGALNTGLDVLATETDEEMLGHAQSLVNESTARLLAVIEFARLAYGASGGAEGDLDSESLKDVSTRLYQHLKPELHWQLDPGAIPKADGRALLNLLLTCERIAPRAGSEITVMGTPHNFSITATGKRAAVPDDVAAAFAGSEEGAEPKLMPARLAQRLVAMTGRSIHVESSDEKVILSVQ
ncbi:MAG: histidine phosphotransferase family protein [Pseudomonadota bacterium]